jgi:hypothetical protein
MGYLVGAGDDRPYADGPGRAAEGQEGTRKTETGHCGSSAQAAKCGRCMSS